MLDNSGEELVRKATIGPPPFEAIEDYEREARQRSAQEIIDYVFPGTETESTLRRNLGFFSKYALRRRVLQGIEQVKMTSSYFGGRITSELPFFPGPVNLGPLYRGALLDELKLALTYSIPIFVSHLSVVEPLQLSELPRLVSSNSKSSLIWQIYLQNENLELHYRQAKLAEQWGYKALCLTVDCELSVKLENKTPGLIGKNSFTSVTPKHLLKLRAQSELPLIVKGVMTAEDAELAVESGADGIVVSNHGGRTLDQGQATLEVLPEIVRALKSKKKTRGAEIFFDGGIRRGTHILMALALGAKGCLIGRGILWGICVDKDRGANNVMAILKSELERAAILSGVRRTATVSPRILRKLS